MNGRPLAGMGILITRPRQLAGPLADGVAALGGTPVLFPAVEIAPPANPAALEAAIASLAQINMVIFVSPTAVAQAMPLIVARHPLWPATTQILAVGQGTAKALAGHGLETVLTSPDRADSEHLLRVPELADVAGKRALIFRGEGGRELLANTLSARGARVEYAECYRRLPPGTDPVPLLERWRQGGIQAVTVTSSELLANLLGALGEAGMALLRATPLFVIHERIARAARERGLDKVTVTRPGDRGLLDGLVECLGHA